MSIFWPTKLKAEPGVLARLGRVLHWLFVAAALACVYGAFVSYSPNDTYWYLPAWSSLGFCMFGRGLRYIFAGE